MNLHEQLIRIADLYAGSANQSRARVATIVFNDGKRFDRVEAGSSLTVRSFEHAMQWFSDHWPDIIEWPVDIHRPTPTEVSEAAE